MGFCGKLLLALIFTFATKVLCEDDTTMGPMFIKEPENRVDFSNTTGAIVECTARGSPRPEIIWIRADGTAVGDVPGLRQVKGDGNLVFPPFRAEDYKQEVHAQVYICMAKNRVGVIHSRDVNVRAVVNQLYQTRVIDEYVLLGNSVVLKCLVPSFVADFVHVLGWVDDSGNNIGTSIDKQVVEQSYQLRVNDEFVLKGNTAILKCIVPSFVGDFLEIIEWVSESGESFNVNQLYKDGKYLVLPSGELHIRDVTPEDGTKSYQCRTKHRLTGETRLSATKGRLVITEPVGFKSPTFPSSSKSSWFVKHLLEHLSLLCSAQGYPIPEYRWYKFIEGSNKKQAVTLDDRIKQVSGTLIIREAKVDDSGKYLCVVNNSVGGESVETVLTVTAPLNAIVEPTIQTVDFGRPATLTCNYEGNPVKTISWLKDGKRLSSHDGRVLRIDSVRKEDKGMYQCFVRNEQESAQGSAELKLGGRFEPPHIKEYFNDNTMQPGVSLHLKCIASGNPTPEINWELDSKRLSSTERLRIGQLITMTGEVVSYLNISSVHTNDGGHYRCVAVSKVGTAEHTAHLNVYGLPFIRPMDKKNIVSGENLFVTCPVAGYPLESITWERDNRQLPINRKQKVFPNGTLIIENVERSSDQATYTCVARNAQGHTAKGNLEVQVMVPPLMKPFSFEGESNVGETAQLTCHVIKGDTPLEITWVFQGPDGRIQPMPQPIIENRIGKKITMLEIPTVTEYHRGSYSCIATNRAGIVNQTAFLMVNVPPSIMPFSVDGELSVGDNAQLTCHVARGDMPINISWTFQSADGGTVGSLPEPILLNRIGKKIVMLEIPSVTEYHRGSYTCIATNRAGVIEHTAELKVNVLPRIRPFEFESAVFAGEPVQLTCFVTKGDKPLRISWYLHSKELTSQTGITTSTMGDRASSLSIASTGLSNAGNYTCVAQNAVGMDSYSAYLEVNVPPRIRPFEFESAVYAGEPIQLTCLVTKGDKPLRISWYLQSKELTIPQTGIVTSNLGDRANSLSISSAGIANRGNYTCVAQNAVGMDSYSAYLEVNVPPRIRPFEFESAVFAGEPVQITCLVTKGDKPLRISWYFHTTELTSSQTGVYTSSMGDRSNILSIPSAGLPNGGNYTCVAQNAVGMDYYSAYLEVNVCPKILPFSFGEIPSNAGDSVQVVCTVVKGDKPLRISWNFYGEELSSNMGITTTPVSDSMNVLSIPSVGTANRGNYTCVAKNSAGYDSFTAQLLVNVPPQILPFSFGDNPSNAGDKVQVGCTVAKGDQPLRITWNFYGEELSSNMGVSTMAVGDSMNVLFIPSVAPSNRGNYTCVAKNPTGYDSYTAQLLVNVRPKILPFSFGDTPSNAGNTVQVACTVSEGDKPLRISWNFYGEDLSSDMGVSTMQVGESMNALFISSVAPSNRGNYTCVAQNSAGFDSFTAQLLVNVRPKILPFSFGDSPSNAGNPVQVGCTVMEGDKPLRITWNFYGEELSSNMGVSTMPVGDSMNVLIIPSVVPSNRGNYTCLAKNSAGNDSFTSQLLVNVPPRWILEPTDKAFAQGGDAKIECKADGFPKPQVTWKKAIGNSPGDYKDIKDLKPGSDDIKVDEGTLSIHNIQKNHEGHYLCEAVNGIGSGLSAVITISVQAPPHFEIKARNQTSEKGQPAVLECMAKGEKPIGIVWNMNNKRLDAKEEERYTIREEILTDGVKSDLSIKRSERIDTAVFTCVATNSFGSDDSSVQLIVQEVPEIPFGLKVLDKSGRTVQLSWLAPYDGNSPITRYIVEYKLLKNTWETDIEKVEATGDKTEMSVVSLHPATTYHFRIVAENGVGVSKPSDPVTIITSEEAPGGKPTNIHVDPIDENTLKVMWKAPERSDWNGEIQGYYVGYKQSSLVENKFVFETVEFSKEEGKEHYLEIFNLKTYTQYTIVVQAFNKLGAGPMSDEIKQYTSEGVPEQPPHDTTCTTLTSQTIRISWVSPPLSTANGVIKGYKVIYGPSDSWFNESTKDTKITVSSETILHGLKKFTNYSMEVLAFTAGGDGVRAPRIYCQTEQDVPEAPAALKALVMSTESVLVSWKPPAEPNGDVNQYTVYIKPSGDNKDKEPLAHKVAPNQMSFEASGLIKQDPYEFWVTASTNIGEGQPTKSIVIAPSTRVPAMIASFDDSFVATYREDVKLPCLTVGVPAPEISWKVKGAPLESNDRIRQLPEGSLLIRSVTRTDAGEYSCFVENSFGKDKITHRIVVLAPPHKPEVSVGATTSNTITLNLKPHAADKEPIHGYTIKYKPEFGDWQTAQVAAKADKFTLENLWCGSRYQIAVTAYNLIGTGDESDLLNTKTTGSKPKIPEASKFIEVSATSVTLHLNAWLDGGCPMLYFVVEHKKKLQSEWTQVSNNVRPGGNFVVLDLDPASWYHLRVTAHNNAGFSVAEYEFASLTLSGGTIAPPAQDVTSIYTYLPWIPKWIDLNVVVPTAATIIVIIVGIIVVCFAWSRRVHENGQTRLRDDMTVYNQSMIMGGNTLDKRHADFNDELGYIAPPNRKLPPVPGSNYNTCDRIKRGFPGPYHGHGTWNPRARHMYEELNGSNPRCRGHLPPCPGSDETMYTRCRGIDGEDICPYATFHLLGFREEMDPSKMPFQTFPHPNGHCGTIGPGGTIASNGLMHQCPGTQTMPRNGRYSRVGGANSMFSPEYDDPANMGDEYGSQYGQYGAPYEQYESRASMAGRSIGSPEPPPPPPRNHDPNVSNTSNEANDSKDSNQISEAECDQHQQPATQNYGETKPQQDNNASKAEGSQPTILWQCNL